MRGFSHLSLAQKIRLLHLVDDYIIKQFLMDTPKLRLICLDENVPDGVEID